jgi:NADPH2:quinone reductase
MRAVVARAFGPPESFAIEDLPTPQPGAGEVRIAVRRVGVSFVDVLTAAGGYQLKPPLPFTPGTEYAGVVDAVGEGVTRLKVGDRVSASALVGSMAEMTIVSSETPLLLPDAMSFEDGSVFRVSYATSYYALVQRGQLKTGETVLVLGAGGAVGVAAIQIAKALGARVIGAASSEAKRALALDAGADEAVDNRAADYRERLKALTGGKGVDVVVDPVGGPATEAAFRSLGWKGRHLVIGFAAGEIPRLPTNLALLKGADLRGVDIRQFGLFEPEESARNAAAILDLYAKGGIRPKIARRYPFEQFAEAMQAAGSGDVAGRIVLEVAED